MSDKCNLCYLFVKNMSRQDTGSGKNTVTFVTFFKSYDLLRLAQLRVIRKRVLNFSFLIINCFPCYFCYLLYFSETSRKYSIILNKYVLLFN